MDKKILQKIVADIISLAGTSQQDIVPEELKDGGYRWYPFRSISSVKMWQDLSIELWPRYLKESNDPYGGYVEFIGKWEHPQVIGMYKMLTAEVIAHPLLELAPIAIPSAEEPVPEKPIAKPKPKADPKTKAKPKTMRK